MGSVFKSESAPTPPPPPKPATIRDEIGGIEQVPVQNADGSITYVTRALPLTAEQKAEKETYNRIMQEALGEIERLSSTGFVHDESTQNVLNEWQKTQTELLDDAFDTRADLEEKSLARRGLGDSSAGFSVRRKRALDEQAAEKNLAREKTSIGEDIRLQKLGLQQNLYGIAANKQGADTALAYQSAAKGLGSVSSINATNQASISDYYNRQLSAYNSSLASNNQGGGHGGFGSMFGGFGGSSSSGGSTGEQVGGTLGTAIGTSIGGPVGGAIGGAIGTGIGGMF